jgi:hypothetical protein
MERIVIDLGTVEGELYDDELLLRDSIVRKLVEEWV